MPAKKATKKTCKKPRATKKKRGQADAVANSRPEGGRRSKLTPEVQTRICEALKAGNYFSTACEFAGVPVQTGYEWLARGEGRDTERPKTELFASFASAVKKAESDAEVASLARIRKSAQGGGVRERKTVTRVIKGRDGAPAQEVTEVTESYFAPAWQADAWMLERRNPERWGRRDRHEHSSPGSDRVEVNLDLQNLITKIYGDAPDGEDTQQGENEGHS